MINTLHIKNFKCFLDQEIRISPLTVFAGANGGGKSTAIQSLLLLRQIVDKLYHPPPIISGTVKLNEAYNLNLGNTKDITCAISNSDEIQFIIGFKDKAMGFTYLALKDSPELYVYVTPDRKAKEILVSGETSVSILQSSFHYLAAERIGPRDVQVISDQDFITTGFTGEYTGYAMYKVAEKKIDQRRCIYNDVIGRNRLFKRQVEAWMDLIIPGIEIHPELYEDINSSRVGLRRRAGETDYLKAANIGFGITYVLPVIVSGLIAEWNSMLIVENPEAHLHPMGQSKIGQFLAQMAGAGVQVIIETHSEHIINGIRLAVLKKRIRHDNVIINFFNQERKSSSPIIESISLNEKADLSDWPKGFLDQEEIDLGEIFRLKRQKNAC